MTNLLRIASLTLIMLVVFQSCNRKMNLDKVNHVVYVILQDKYDTFQFLKRYAVFGAKDLSGSNRTLKEYRVNFYLEKTRIEDLRRQLSNDEVVISFREISSIQDPINSKSKKKSSIPPIKDNG